MTLVISARKRLYHALEHYDRSDPASVIISSIVVGVIAINLIAIILESIPAYAVAYGETFLVIELTSCIFFMISMVWRVSKSMTHVKKSSPECFGTPKNQAGWAGLARCAVHVAIVSPMEFQWGAPIASGLQNTTSDPRKTLRAGTPYARFLKEEIRGLMIAGGLHALRPEASAD